MEWIAIKDRLPEKEGRYFVFAESEDSEKPFIQIAWYEPSGFGWSLIPSVWMKAISHWMPLPTRPNKKNMNPTEMQRLTDFYYECGVIVSQEPIDDLAGGYKIRIKVGMSDVISGYDGFVTDFFFDKEGNFKYQKIWE